jgi:large subunit ribosomal protein L5
MTAIKLTSNEYFDNAYLEVAKELNTTNKFAIPKITKATINVGIGKFEKAQKEEIIDLIEKLTGQIPKKVNSRVSVAGFKMRAGDLVGVTVTLRGQKMRDFLFNLVYLALPRTKDFKGIKGDSFSSTGANYSVGIPDSSIFPQIGFNLKVVFGMQITVTFKEPSPNNKLLLSTLKFPFKK